jgi:diguanylate cyclase (GGDEF)-like protein
MDTLSPSDRAHVLQTATAQFWVHIVPIVRVAFALHVILFGVFLVLRIEPLLIGNGMSILAYIACLHAIERKRFHFAGLLMSVEVIAHAALATWVLGWDSNFYFFLFCIVPLLSFSFQDAPIRRLSLSFAIVGVAVGGYVLRDHSGIATGLTPSLLNAFGVINAIVATCLLFQATALLVRYTLSMQLLQFHSANRDSLTNLYTRRRVLQQVHQVPHSVPVSVLLLDIDHFKAINDRYGHDVGDLVLKRVAEVITDSVRDTDIAARWGGEEFLVLMLDTPLEEARRVAERIRHRLQEAAQVQTVTATFAIAQLQPRETFVEGFSRADQALFLGKRQGRDRIMIANGSQVSNAP